MSLDSIHIIKVGASLVHQIASSASTEVASQPQIALSTSPESRFAGVATQSPSPVRPPSLIPADREGGGPSDSDAAKSPDGEARAPLSERETPGDGPAAAQQASSAPAAAAPGRAELGSARGLPREHPMVDAGANREEQSIDDQQAEGHAGRAAAVLFHGDMTASRQGAEEFELVTHGVCVVPGEGSGDSELGR